MSGRLELLDLRCEVVRLEAELESLRSLLAARDVAFKELVAEVRRGR